MLSRPVRLVEPGKTYMFIDVGGGSTEITLFADGRTLDSASFAIGGIRILKGGVSPEDWQEMKRWLKNASKGVQPVISIGSGGNINKVFRLARKKESEQISYKKIQGIYEYVKGFTYEERIQQLNLRPDRADVIVPACEIYLSAMKWAKSKRMYVPMAGLSDGLVHLLYLQHRNGKAAETGIDDLVSAQGGKPL
jgi:exopolyphosphatase/guanosine-5'-triphosphate,3'-diphosphate pyrophosphatase